MKFSRTFKINELNGTAKKRYEGEFGYTMRKEYQKIAKIESDIAFMQSIIPTLDSDKLIDCFEAIYKARLEKTKIEEYIQSCFPKR